MTRILLELWTRQTQRVHGIGHVEAVHGDLQAADRCFRYRSQVRDVAVRGHRADEGLRQNAEKLGEYLATGRPVPDALVVILWQRFDDEIQGLRRLVTARETFTDSNGAFVHDVGVLESKLPPGTLTPRLLVFRPGFTSVPSGPQVSPPGVSASQFTGPGGVATVTPVSDYEDRAEAFNTFIAMLSNAQLFPPTGLPDTEELVRFELQSLGVRPPLVTPRGGR